MERVRFASEGRDASHGVPGRGPFGEADMIRYALRCADGHVFESWFASAETYDRLAKAGGLSCAMCGSEDVAKTLMAPSVAVSEKGGKAKPAGDAAVAPAAPAAPEHSAPMLSAPNSPLEAALKSLRAKVEANAENVGKAFPRMAREMHAGEAEDRPIYGEATRDEARELIDDGVPVAPLPWLTRRDD